MLRAFAVFSAAGFFVQTPFGPRKSGIPDSVEIPAPVRITIASALRIHSAIVSSPSSLIAAERSGGCLDADLVVWGSSGVTIRQAEGDELLTTGEAAALLRLVDGAN